MGFEKVENARMIMKTVGTNAIRNPTGIFTCSM